MKLSSHFEYECLQSIRLASVLLIFKHSERLQATDRA